MSHESTRFTYKSRPVALIAAAIVLACGLAQAQDVPPAVVEKNVTGNVEVGNRWQWFNGNRDLYRSTVNLGEGPKLLNFSTNYRGGPETAPRWFDHAAIRATSWGGDPANTLSLNFGRSRGYEFSALYRKIDYFNSLPSFANPTAARAGATQSSFDIERRLADARLTLFPESSLLPFVAFEFDSGDGPGRTNFVQNGNEYAVNTHFDNRTVTFRAGIEARFNRWFGIVEAGGSRYHDDQVASTSGPNLGNRTTLFLGRRLQLDELNQRYDVRGTDRFVRATAEYKPHSTVTLNGRFSFSQAETKATHAHDASGLFVIQQTLQFLTNESSITRTEAVWPHPSGSIGIEFRPIGRLRIAESVSTDRFNFSGGGADFTRQRLDATFDWNRFLSIYGGHTFLNASATSPGSQLAASEDRDIQRNEFTAGMALRAGSRLRVNFDAGSMHGDDVFFRTDQRRRRRARVRGRYQLTETLEFGVVASIWNNDNNAADVDFSERSREASADVTFTPGGGKHVSMFASYTRGTFRSDVPFIVPQNFQRDRSIYRDRGHTGTLAVTLNTPYRVGAQFGGSFFVSTASVETQDQTRPTRFYRPYARVSIDLIRSSLWLAEWNWYGYSHKTFRLEDYRAHLFTTGVEYRF